MVTEFRCPECGGRLQIEENVTKGEHYAPRYQLRTDDIPVRFVTVPAVAFCSECEFVLEIATTAKG